VTLRRPEIADGIEYIAEPQKIPRVLSPEEVRRLIAAAPSFKYRLSIGAQPGPTTTHATTPSLPALRCAARLQPWRHDVTT
jgi:hypothetical protein